MKTDQKIEKIRQLMRKADISAIVVPSDDPHKSEYVAEHWQVRKWLTGFSGSAGIAVVTLEHAVLWTDSRYYIQAENEISGSEFALLKMGEPDVPGVEKWLKQNLKSGDCVGINGSVFSASGVEKLEKEIKAEGIVLDTTVDFISGIWKDRPSIPASSAFLYSREYAGESRGEKITRIREKMGEHGASYHLITTLDDIAWTLNLRGSDVHTNPVNVAFLMIGPDEICLFMEMSKANGDVLKELKKDGIRMLGYEEVAQALMNLTEDASILVDPENINYALYRSISPGCRIVKKNNPAIAFKAIKNEIQIQHLRQTAVKDGIAVVNFLFWLDQRDGKEDITEQSAADILYTLRKEHEGFIDNSFDPIIAWKDHSAVVHYNATDESDAVISQNGMLLADSGGNYLAGTTDITRTVYIGDVPKQAVMDYTLVLKGHIALASSYFPKGTKGFQVDTLARQYLWGQGMNFGHGTGHGVGFFLCVHEGPASISPFPADVKLEKGMLLTNEPGVYRDGVYGIRLENMILVDQAFENEFGIFLKFENMTWCHFEKNLMNKTMMSEKEINWVDEYHQQVYEKLHNGLKPEVADWLREKTNPL